MNDSVKLPNDDGVPVLNCPGCKRLVRWEPASTCRPFCSERCRLIDLGAWASERYAIPAQIQPDDFNEGE
jgi:hypothetical protein